MGLAAGFMSSLYAGTSLVMASPLDFIANPLLWSDMVETYKATLTCAPNFAYALLLKRLEQANQTANWSCVKRAMFGGEPAQSRVVEAAAKTLSIKPEHIYNIYGMAESVVFLTGGPANPDSEGLVSCGEAASPTLKLQIVEDGKEVEEGQVGSIWAQSPRVAAGYYGQSELTTATFANALPGYDSPWLDTGDLGKIVDGQLYVTGRVKDVIIINGKNYYPTDVELSIDETFGDVIRPGRTTAFQHGEDSIGITVEGRKGFDKTAKSDLALQISNHVSQVHGLLAHEMVVLKLGVTPKTTSGKLKRSEIRQTTVARDWKESSVLLHFERKEVAAPLPQQHVAVVGAGAAGLIAALRLAQRNIKVTLLECNEQIGGHARHVEVFGHERNPAFGVFISNESPNLMALAEELGVAPIHLGESRQARGLVSQKSQPIPEVPQSEISRFIAEMQRVHKAGSGQNETIGEFLDQNGYDQHFIVYFYVGRIVSFFAGQSIQDYLNIPLELVAWFVIIGFAKNRALLRMSNREYMESFWAQLQTLGVEIKTNVATKVVFRDDSGVTLSTGSCGNEDVLKVDKLVLAVPPNAAAQILENFMSPQENVLTEFDCPLETVVMHTDSKWIDSKTPCVLFANILDWGKSTLPAASDTIPLTTSFPSDTDGKTPIYVTHAYNTYEELEFDSPVETMSFTHTRITCKAIELRNSLLQHQGNNSTYFAGGWTRGTMLHEDAIVSGILASNAVLENFGMKPHPVLERETIVPSNHLSGGGITDHGQSDIQAPTKDGFSNRYSDIILSVFGSEIDSSKTWAENGLTSLNSAELRNRVEEKLPVVLPSNFEQLYATPKELEVFLVSSEGKHFPCNAAAEHVDFHWNSPGSQCGKLEMSIAQVLGFIAITLVLLTAIFPSYLVAARLASKCSTSEDQQCLKTSFLWFPLLFPLFVFSFSIMVVLCKILVVGMYRPQEINLMSWHYLRWWFVDRLLHIWELFVGRFLLETKFAWLFYRLLGADLAWSTKIDAFIRECDLVSVGVNSSVSHAIRCRKFRPWTEGSPRMIFRPIIVGPNCEVSGMISPGAVIGAGCIVEKLTVVEEGAQVPDCVIARGIPAHNGGSYNHHTSNWKEESLLDGFKILWMVSEAYHYSALYFLAHGILNNILPIWRYHVVLHWFLLFPLASLFAVVTSILMKWLLIGKRDPSEAYQGTCWRRATNWACDYHFRVAAWMLGKFMGTSRFDTFALWCHGLDVDVVSVLHTASTIFSPSKVDYVKIRNSFLALTEIELDIPSGEKIEISHSSVGRNTIVGAGAKVIRSNLPSRSQVSDKIYDFNPPNRCLEATWRFILLEVILPEVALLILIAIIFWSIIPVYELSAAIIGKSSSPSVLVLVIVGATVFQFLIWILLAKIIEWAFLNVVPQNGFFHVYIFYAIWFRGGNPIEMVLMGTVFFKHYAQFMGAEVDGDLLFFDSILLEFGNYHFQGNTYPRGHYFDINGLTIDDVYISGVVHPGCYIAAGAVVNAEECGPWKSFFPSAAEKVASSKRHPSRQSLQGGTDRMRSERLQDYFQRSPYLAESDSTTIQPVRSISENSCEVGVSPESPAAMSKAGLLSKDSSLRATCALELGIPATSFELPNSQGEGTTSLQDLVETGKWTVLYFYPAAFTSGCTLQACSFQRDIDQYRQLNAQIVGVSVDSVEKNKAFCSAENLGFFMLSDQGGCVSQTYGSAVSIPGSGTISNRQTYLIDPQGRLRWIFHDFESRIARHSKDVLDKLQELEATDEIC
ncbi:MSMEG_5435/MSMEI_5285 [Seminavis robusta]|uniref:MSMEG_5435/MSMEI_5285 n=1 Tax=Seminavis robusta TaxID=568900 RepID=A0A9N8HZV8_9STRA|nr:MSMEG_5435/MSMEI_5285 [Seminavis robusta]|eukprot:Sro3186_g344880.1 MSMEG_5435/MSMEI_5285 (1764) ;mRNA; r:1512-6885